MGPPSCTSKARRVDTLEAIRTRRTIGVSTGDVSRETIAELIEAATWAPNHRMTQPWKFTVVTGTARERLGEVWGRDASAGIVDEKQRQAVFEGEKKKPLRAPALIIVSVRTAPDPVTAEEDLVATSAGVQNLLLAAHSKGLSAGWKTGKIVSSDAVKQFLGLERRDHIIAVVYLGAKTSEAPAPKKRSVNTSIRWLDQVAVTV